MHIKLAFLSLCLSILGFSGSIEGKHIYAFIGADTISTVKESCKIDQERMKKAVHGIAAACMMDLKLTMPQGKKLTPKAINRWLDKLHPGKEDIVFFYFAGHGNHKGPKKNQWPAMYLTAKKSYVHLTKVIKRIKRKHQRLAIVLSDCCNNTIQSANALGHPPLIPPHNVNLHEVHGIQSLFKNTKGLIVATGSVPGSRAWSTSQGGLFTHAFLYCLQREVLTVNPTWKRLFDQTIDVCQGIQKPQAKLSIKQFS